MQRDVTRLVSVETILARTKLIWFQSAHYRGAVKSVRVGPAGLTSEELCRELFMQPGTAAFNTGGSNWYILPPGRILINGVTPIEDREAGIIYLILTVPCFGWLVQHLVVLAASGKLSEGSGLGPVDAIAWLFALQIAIEATCDVMVRLEYLTDETRREWTDFKKAGKQSK